MLIINLMRRLVLWIAGTLTGASFIVISACAADAPDGRTESRLDSATDMGGDERAAPLDAGSDVGVDAAPCVSTFTVTSDCRHPAVVRTCVGGFCKIPPGCFVMGAPECQFGRGLRDENEVQVTITRTFEIEQYEADQADWVAAGFPNPSRVDEGRSGDYGDCLEPNCPVGHVTWFEALAYANRRSEMAGLPRCYLLGACTGDVGTGMKCDEVSLASSTLYECAGYRLPTEAEWEYAVRAGTRTAFYSGGIRPLVDTALCEVDKNLIDSAWYCVNSSRRTHPQGGKAANAWGLFDTSGNAEEWVHDRFNGLGYGAGPLTDPHGTLEIDGTELARTTRGGDYVSTSPALTSSSRGMLVPETVWPGFRLARTLDVADAGR